MYDTVTRISLGNIYIYINNFERLTVTALFLLCISSLTAGQSVDQTRVEGSSGALVVNAAIAQVELSGVFSDDRSFLRRIAYVESRDGTRSDTYPPGYYGGIWKVDLVAFQSTQNNVSYPDLVALHKKIQEHFCIDWTAVQWIDLRKPLFSAFAARLFLSIITQPIPPASDLQGQAMYWKQYYNPTSVNKTVQNFIDDVRELNNMEGQ